MKRMLSFSLAAALFLPLLLCSGCAPLGLFRSGASPAPSQAPVLSQPTAQPIVSDNAPKPDMRYCRQQLSGAELELYLRVLDAVQNAEPTITETSFDRDTLSRMVDYVRADYPELFWLLGTDTLTTTMIGGVPTEITLTFRYSIDAADLPAATAQVEAAAQECLSGIDPAWSDYDKIKAVYDWIVRRTEYDPDANDQSLYTVLVSGRGVCAGYAKATQYLLNQLGIPCTYVTGTVRGAGHGWNLVWAEGAWYYLDPTWGDPLFSDGEQDPDYVSYNYFCVTTDELFRTHTPDDLFPLPVCTATACNYFVRSGLLLDGYDYDAVLEILRQAVNEGRDATIRFSSAQALEQADHALTGEYKLFDMLKEIDGGSGVLDTSVIHHSVDEELNIFNVYFTFR
ncbi:transglutaminase domain-containing protein [uncultured Pseudoflavonifractor sp.]|uniref:transglutaminase domain-containing protein n=1 Tax=uncultured Pseudoflavonifractor sp. TaxID=1221379 RepID=UPI0025DE0658|nr:transglutaminase domain-containing protein [uncultured Pseudoflavonifractor sp.]